MPPEQNYANQLSTKKDLVTIIGAFIGATNIPERWFPGSLDLIFNSHHLMHLLVVYAAYQMHTAVFQDLVWMSRIKRHNLDCPEL